MTKLGTTAIIYQTIGALFGFLSLATLAGLLLQGLHRDRDLSDLRRRISAWWFILPPFALALMIRGPLLVILLGLVSFMGFKEFVSAIPTRLADRRTIFALYLAIPVQFYWAWHQSFEMFTFFIPLYLFMLIAVMSIVAGETRGFLTAAATLNWGLILIVFSLSHLGYLGTVSASAANPAGGAGLVLYLVVLTQLNDVAQYCWGKLFGRGKIVPRLSPNKTYAGFLGGLVTSSMLSIPLGGALASLRPAEALVAGLVISIGGFLGDVLVSGVKRDLGIKDFGSLIPGHGGILDRIDSLTVSAPLFFHFIRSVHLGGQL